MANPQHDADHLQPADDHGHGGHDAHDAHAHEVASDYIPEGHFADTALKILALVFAPIGMILFAAVMWFTPIPEHHGGGAEPTHESESASDKPGHTTGTTHGH